MAELLLFTLISIQQWKGFPKHTIARGNCKSINNAMAGKMTSDVRGLEEVSAAVAKELKATSKGIPLQRAELQALKQR